MTARRIASRDCIDNDARALQSIADHMTGNSWSYDTLAEVWSILKMAGFTSAAPLQAKRPLDDPPSGTWTIDPPAKPIAPLKVLPR